METSKVVRKVCLSDLLIIYSELNHKIKHCLLSG